VAGHAPVCVHSRHRGGLSGRARGLTLGPPLFRVSSARSRDSNIGLDTLRVWARQSSAHQGIDPLGGRLPPARHKSVPPVLAADLGHQSATSVQHAQKGGQLASLGGCGQISGRSMWRIAAGRVVRGPSASLLTPPVPMGISLYKQPGLLLFCSAPDGQGAALERGVVSIQRDCSLRQHHRLGHGKAAQGPGDSTDY